MNPSKIFPKATKDDLNPLEIFLIEKFDIMDPLLILDLFHH